MKTKFLIYMIVNGEYQYYIPFFLYFLKKSYPDYHCMISCKWTLNDTVREQCEKLKFYDYKNKNNENLYHIYEAAFPDFQDNPDIIKTLRWTTYTPFFDQFDLMYIGDIDIFIMPEKIKLHEQHLDIMNKNRTCYSNTDKIDPPETRGNRMTGLHCFKPKKYFQAIREVALSYNTIIKAGINSNDFINEKLNKVMDNQHILWKIIYNSGLPMPNHNFFSYHGLHLGHSRVKNRWSDLFSTDKLHLEYFIKMVKIIDDDFFYLLRTTNNQVKKEILTMIKSGEGYVKKDYFRGIVQK